MELSGLNAEPKQKDFTSKSNTIYRQNSLDSNNIKVSHKNNFLLILPNLTLTESSTILTSYMTSQITMDFFLSQCFFCMVFTSDSFIHGGKCHKLLHSGRKHRLLNVVIPKMHITDVSNDVQSSQILESSSMKKAAARSVAARIDSTVETVLAAQ
jgi:hypothetical protein